MKNKLLPLYTSMDEAVISNTSFTKNYASKRIGKLLILVFMACAYTQTSNAQSYVYNEDIERIKYEIEKKLKTVVQTNRNEKTWDSETLDLFDIGALGGMEKNNWAYIHFWYPAKRGFYHFTSDYYIDLSRIAYVITGKTYSGKDGFFFYANSGEQAIQSFRYYDEEDYNRQHFNKWVDNVTIFMPQDKELLGLFNDYIKLIKADKKAHPDNYGTLKQIVNEKK
ncbi:hypothetical protein [Mariniflexile sp.]|uniref:hypothetical protein n=1 Tax=Mariniflexile sp. TaxID=1979402 RepID=UPI0040488AD3